jgi:hypothetical protein
MTDKTYYELEDDITNPDAEFDNLKAQEHALSTVVAETADQVNRVAQVTEYLYGRQTDPDDAAFIREVYEIANVMGTRIAQQAIAHKAAGEFARKMFEYYQQMLRNHNDITDKVEEVEEALDELRSEFDEAMAEAYENIFAEMHENIRQLTGCADWGVIYRFNDLLVGNNENPTPEQVELLNRLLSTFEQPAPEQG